MTLRARGVLPLTRRSFLTKAGVGIAAAGVAPDISAPFVSSAFAQTKTLTIVQWSHFVPAFDTWFDKFAHDWGEKNGIAVTVDHIPEQNIAARAAAEVAAGAGHDLFSVERGRRASSLPQISGRHDQSRRLCRKEIR